MRTFPFALFDPTFGLFDPMRTSPFGLLDPTFGLFDPMRTSLFGLLDLTRTKNGWVSNDKSITGNKAKSKAIPYSMAVHATHHVAQRDDRHPQSNYGQCLLGPWDGRLPLWYSSWFNGLVQSIKAWI